MKREIVIQLTLLAIALIMLVVALVFQKPMQPVPDSELQKVLTEGAGNIPSTEDVAPPVEEEIVDLPPLPDEQETEY